MKSPNRVHRLRQRNQGAALIIGLILLIVMTLLGLSSMRTVVHEEKMATQVYDRSMMFQSVESALRQAEERIEADKPTPTLGCTDGLCAAPASNTTPRWKDVTFTGWFGASITNSMAGTPEYFIEYLGSNFSCDPSSSAAAITCKNYRVTARSAQTAGRAAVMLQSVYLTD